MQSIIEDYVGISSSMQINGVHIRDMHAPTLTLHVIQNVMNVAFLTLCMLEVLPKMSDFEHFTAGSIAIAAAADAAGARRAGVPDLKGQCVERVSRVDGAVFPVCCCLPHVDHSGISMLLLIN